MQRVTSSLGGQRFHLGGTDCKSRRLGVGRTWKAGLKDAMAARARHRGL